MVYSIVDHIKEYIDEEYFVDLTSNILKTYRSFSLNHLKESFDELLKL